MTAAPTETETREELACPHCGALAQPGQEYCLECGGRLPETAPRRPVRAAGDWAVPVLVALVVAVLAASVVVAALASRADEDPFFTATTFQATPPPTTEAFPVQPTAQEPPATAAPPAQTAPPPPTAGPPAAPQSQLVTWPSGSNGYTVVLASLPAAGGRAAAVRNAREAVDSGLPEVGVLRSDRYASLHPGYFVVFSGVYDSFGAAEQAVAAARQAGYDAAYARQIAA